MTIPTEGELFAQLTEHIRKTQEITATLSHLAGENRHPGAQRGWLAVSEQMRVVNRVVIQIAKGKMQ